MRNRGIRRKRARRRERYSVDLRPYLHLDEAVEQRDAPDLGNGAYARVGHARIMASSRSATRDSPIG